MIPTVPTKLTMTRTERDDYRRLNAFVAGNLHTAENVVRAIKDIRDRRLYRDHYENFDEWIWEEHSITRRRADQQIAFIEMKDDLGTNRSQLIDNEWQARELAKASPDLRPVILDAAAELGGRVTAERLAYLRAKVTASMSADELVEVAQAEAAQVDVAADRSDRDDEQSRYDRAMERLEQARKLYVRVVDETRRAALKAAALAWVAAWN